MRDDKESVQGKWSIIIWIKQPKQQIWTFEYCKKKVEKAYAKKRENNIAQGRHSVLSPHTNVHVCPAIHHASVRVTDQVSLMPLFWAT